MDVSEILEQSIDAKKTIKAWLVINNYDGLFNKEGECGCEIDDLFPCSEYDNNEIFNCDCRAGYKGYCKNGHGWFIGTKGAICNCEKEKLLCESGIKK